jgi:DNA helicase-2/ATP-dependent DNA helicase PcrA
MSLNPPQRAAVEHRGSPLLVLAGAGTGKTRVICHRVASILEEGIPAWRVLAVTFTNRAAGQMRQRIDRLCEGRDDVHELWVGTFHSICARILRRHGEAVGLSPRFSIYDTADQRSVMKRVLEEMRISDKQFTPSGVLSHIDRAKNQGLDPDGVGELLLPTPVERVVRSAWIDYQKKLLAADAVDFGDLLLHAVRALKSAIKPSSGQLGDLDPIYRLTTRFKHVVVDEFQDTNPVQAQLVDLLARRAELCVVGDDDQAIYGWRGADVAQILHFADRHDGTETIRLEQNYRSTMHVLRCADAVIRKNRGRLGKTLWSDNGDGHPVRVFRLESERDEARLIASEIRHAIDEGEDPEEIAIFYRTHAQSRVLEDEVRRSGLGCRIVGGVAFYERQEVKDALAYLQVLRNPASDAHVLRVLNRPARGIGKTSTTRLSERAAALDKPLWDALQDPAAAGLKASAAKRVASFVDVIRGLQREMEGMPLDELLAQVIDATGYREMLAADDSDEGQTRLENLQELHGNVVEFMRERPQGTLEEFLELVSLAGGERAEGDASRAVTLMTVHTAKGLEFERVYLTGMEERVFPHARVLEDDKQLEEERRLAYVALTRAKKHLTLTMAARRMIFGQTQAGLPSRFVLDLPRESTEQVGRIDTPRSASLPSAAPSRQPQTWQDDIVYDADPGIDSPFDASEADADEGIPLYVGMMVRTRTFGEAEVLGWSGSGAKLKLQLRLRTREIKTIMARFVEPL